MANGQSVKEWIIGKKNADPANEPLTIRYRRRLPCLNPESTDKAEFAINAVDVKYRIGGSITRSPRRLFGVWDRLLESEFRNLTQG